jgi:hypothetical protein
MSELVSNDILQELFALRQAGDAMANYLAKTIPCRCLDNSANIKCSKCNHCSEWEKARS